MGSFFSRLYFKLLGRKNMRVLILGLENAGKTTFLYNLVFRKPIETIPSNLQTAIGFNIESYTLQNVNLQIWDLGGQKTFRSHWRSYFPNTQGLIYIIDSSDRARLELAKQELLNVLSDEDLKATPLLVLANKQDLPDSLSESFISDYLDLNSLARPAKVFGSSFKQESSETGLLWLVNASESLIK